METQDIGYARVSQHKHRADKGEFVRVTFQKSRRMDNVLIYLQMRTSLLSFFIQSLGKY